MFRIFVVFAALFMLFSSTAYSASPDAVVTGEGDLRITGNGNGLVFPDGTTQYTATVSGGTVTSVNTGSGLTGGPITGSGTISIAPGGITSTMLSNILVLPITNGGTGATTSSTALTALGGVNKAGDTMTGPLSVVGSVNATSFSGDGSGLSNIWKITGNAGTTPGTNFIGTTDTQALEIRVNNTRAIRIEPNVFTGGTSTNIMLGSSTNVAGGGPYIIAATVAGGGSTAMTCLDPSSSQVYPTYTRSCANIASSYYSTVGGGASNLSEGYASTVAGGASNIASAIYSFIGGGTANKASWSLTSNAIYSTIGGGAYNTANGQYSAIGGGMNNTTNGNFSTVAGGVDNFAGGDFSFAAGKEALVRDAVTVGSGTTGDQGTFLWSDSGNNYFWSQTSNEFAARATGGFRFVTAVDSYSGYPTRTFSIAADGAVVIPVDDYSPSLTLKSTVANDYARLRLQPSSGAYWDIATGGGSSDVFNIWRSDKGNIISMTPNDSTNLIMMSNGAHLTAGGAWTNSSDRNLKTGFIAVDAKNVLEKVAALPITTWSYKNESSDVRHIGPMAQDFYDTFKLGSDDKSISTVDASGVALAAIKALKAENDSLKIENEAMKIRLDRIELLLHAELSAKAENAGATSKP